MFDSVYILTIAVSLKVQTSPGMMTSSMLYTLVFEYHNQRSAYTFHIKKTVPMPIQLDVHWHCECLWILNINPGPVEDFNCFNSVFWDVLHSRYMSKTVNFPQSYWC